MIKEINCETIKNSKGEISRLCHFVLDSTSDIENLPKDVAIGSDALVGDAVYVKFPRSWRKI